MAEEGRGQADAAWHPMVLDEFWNLAAGRRLRDRRGRVWRVHVGPHERDGRDWVTLVAGGLVRHVERRWIDDYMLIDDRRPADQS